MIRRPPRSTLDRSSAASDVYKRQEHHAYGETDEESGEYTEDLAAQMLATTQGIEFDPDVAWKEREQVFKMGGKIVRTLNITQSAVGRPNRWTCVIALAVFIPTENIPKSLRDKA